MAAASDPFYGCLCLETSSDLGKPLLAPRARQSATPPIPLPEIHFNIWEEGADKDSFLDIGIMLAVDDPAERIEIFLPWELCSANIEDLSPRILKENGVSAIFNEAWSSSTAPNNPGGFVTRSCGSIFTIIPYDQPIIKRRKHHLGQLCSIVLNLAQLKAISNNAATNAPSPPRQMYIRFRVKSVPREFYRVGFDHSDALGGGAFNRTEIIDFRLNIRRGVPAAIEHFLDGRFIDFSKVQLFLMKSRNQDIVFEDKLFKACRSLEDENFWAGYILPSGASAKILAKKLKHVKRSLGYQWRKTSEPDQAEVTEFGMLARFKWFKMRLTTILVFIILAILLGVAGNGVYDYLIRPFLPDGKAKTVTRDDSSPGLASTHADRAPATTVDTKSTQNSAKEIRK